MNGIALDKEIWKQVAFIWKKAVHRTVVGLDAADFIVFDRNALHAALQTEMSQKSFSI